MAFLNVASPCVSRGRVYHEQLHVKPPYHAWHSCCSCGYTSQMLSMIALWNEIVLWTEVNSTLRCHCGRVCLNSRLHACLHRPSSASSAPARARGRPEGGTRPGQRRRQRRRRHSRGTHRRQLWRHRKWQSPARRRARGPGARIRGDAFLVEHPYLHDQRPERIEEVQCVSVSAPAPAPLITMGFCLHMQLLMSCQPVSRIKLQRSFDTNCG